MDLQAEHERYGQGPAMRKRWRGGGGGHGGLRGFAEMPAEREAQIQRHKLDEMRGKFDLRTGPLIRGRLLRLQPREHMLLITMHHIISDGWSLGVLMQGSSTPAWQEAEQKLAP